MHAVYLNESYWNCWKRGKSTASGHDELKQIFYSSMNLRNHKIYSYNDQRDITSIELGVEYDETINRGGRGRVGIGRNRRHPREEVARLPRGLEGRIRRWDGAGAGEGEGGAPC